MMNTRSVFGRGLVWLAVASFCFPQIGWTANPSPVPAVTDVALRDGGLLIGQVVNPQGVAMEAVAVSVRYDGQELVNTKTGKDGYFAVKGLRGGVHQIITTQGHGVYRLWTVGTAPPVAQEGALLVADGRVVAGQQQDPQQQPQQEYYEEDTQHGHLKAFLSNPLVVAGIVATAVAVPVVVYNNQHKPSSP
jgi:hypothetical protein